MNIHRFVRLYLVFSLLFFGVLYYAVVAGGNDRLAPFLQRAAGVQVLLGGGLLIAVLAGRKQNRSLGTMLCCAALLAIPLLLLFLLFTRVH